jgi:hypothetical protein
LVAAAQGNKKPGAYTQTDAGSWLTPRPEGGSLF